MAAVRATFEVIVEMPDADAAQATSELNYTYDTFDVDLPDGWDVVRVTRRSIERLD